MRRQTNKGPRAKVGLTYYAIRSFLLTICYRPGSDITSVVTRVITGDRPCHEEGKAVPQPFTTHLDTLQRRIGQELFARVAGPEGSG